jgi:hypothetical protein
MQAHIIHATSLSKLTKTANLKVQAFDTCSTTTAPAAQFQDLAMNLPVSVKTIFGTAKDGKFCWGRKILVHTNFPES